MFLMLLYLQASLTKTNSANTTGSASVDKQMAENLAQDMSDLMHDFDVVSRINSMVSIYHPNIDSVFYPWIHPSQHCIDPLFHSSIIPSIHRSRWAACAAPTPASPATAWPRSWIRSRGASGRRTTRCPGWTRAVSSWLSGGKTRQKR